MKDRKRRRREVIMTGGEDKGTEGREGDKGRYD
jgi:hypothetical protein